MSSFGIRPDTKRINVDEHFLPYPATKLVISQYLKSHAGRPAYWAWIIVGAFYDKDDKCLWSTKVFAAHLDVDPDYEPFQWSSEESEPESDIDTEVESETEVDAEQGQQGQAPTQLSPPPRRFHPTFQPAATPNSLSQRLPPHLVPFHQQPYHHPAQPFHQSPAQGYWNPSLYSTPPGVWVSAFDPYIGNWVNTWQPE